MKAAERVEAGKRILAFHANQSPTRTKAIPPKSGVGFLLVDCSFSPVSFNGEAIQILGYPDNIEKLTRSELQLTEEIRSRLKTGQSSDDLLFVTEFQSGKRRYSCRAFHIKTHKGTYGRDQARPSIAVLLERGLSALVPLSEVCQRFNLTQREREVLHYLLQGMRNQEIANRMNLSPNTVRAFLRLIMIKTGVSSRSGLVSKIILAQPQ